MNIAIKLLEEEIERQTIFLKAESDPEYIVKIQKDIDILNDAVKKLTIPVVVASKCECDAPFIRKGEKDSEYCGKCELDL